MNSLNPRTILTRVLLILIAVLLLVERSDAWSRRSSCTAVNCVVSSWTSWSTCTANCGATGASTRTRTVTRAATCGGSCPYALSGTRFCDCTYTNPAFGPCSHSCGTTGTQSKTRVLAIPASCGKNCSSITEIQNCSRVCCPKNCNVTSWTPWTGCDAACGAIGNQTRTRNVTDAASCGGTCPALNEIQNCTKRCDDLKPPTTPLTFVTVNESSTLSINCSSGLSGESVQYNGWLKYDSSGSTVEITNSAVLLIPSVNRSDAGIYICNITDASVGPLIFKNVSVSVQFHPTILTHPKSQTVPEGSNVTFSCSADGFPTPEITWKRGSTLLVNSSSSLYSSDGTHITLTNVSKSDAASYTCVASNGNSVTSNAAQLTVGISDHRKPPTVPQSQVTVNESSTLSINCSSGLPAQGVKYIWLKYDSSGSTVEVTNSAVLLIPSVNRNDAGIYICNITDASIGSLIYKNVSVSVQYRHKPPTVPQSQVTVNESSTLSINCSSGLSGESVQYNGWLKYDSSGSTVEITNSAVLLIPSVNRSDAGIYICNITDASVGPLIYKNVSVSVQYIDQPTLNTTRNITVNETAPLYVHCSVASHPAAQYRWIPSSGKVVSSSAVLAFDSITRSNATAYQCEVSNAAGSKISGNLDISVQYIDEPTFNTTSNITVNETATLYVSCSVSSIPAAQYKWTSSSGKVVSSSPVLSFHSISRSNATAYQCIVSNEAGSKTSRNLNINVQYIDQPSLNTTRNITVNETAPLYVHCSVASNPAAQYRWIASSGKVVSSSAVLAFDSITRSNATGYQCEVSNAAGSKISGNLDIRVQYIDEPTFNTTSNITVNETATLYVSCLGSSIPAAQYKWTSSSGKVVSSSPVLAFHSISRSNATAYQCIVSNAAGSKTSRNLNINVQYIDQPSLNTTRNITVNETAPLYVHCSVASNPAAQYRWIASSGKVVSSSAVLAFDSITRSNATAYQCAVSNAAGTKISKNIVISVQYIDKPTFNTTSDITVNETATLYVSCSVSFIPAAQYKWTSLSGKVVSSSHVLAFHSVSRTNATAYQCIVSNEAGSKTSRNLNINVQYIDQPTLNTTRNITVNETAPLYVHCSVASYPAAQYRWIASSGKVVSSSAVLAFDSITRSNATAYQCAVSNAAGTKITKNIVISVQYIDEPTFNTTSDITVNETATLYVSCSVSSIPAAQYKWTSLSGKVVSSSLVLAFHSVSRTNATAYQCIVSNAAGSKTSRNLNINVQYIDQPTLNTTRNITVNETAPLYVHCSVASYPAAQYRWIASSGKVVSSSAVLAFDSITRSNATAYQCAVSNAAGTKITKNIVISVQYIDEPTFNTTSNITVNETATLYVSCSVSSIPAAQYKWTSSSGEIVSSSPVLAFHSISRSNATAYQCIVSNEAGSKTSRNLNINVQYIDEPTFNTASNITVNETAPLYVHCSVSSKPAAQYKWTASSGKVVSSSAALAFDSISRSNATAYQCVVSNAAGSKTSRNLNINVQYIDSPKLNSSTSITLNETDPFYVRCSVNSNLPATHQWTSKSETVVSNSPVLAFNSVRRIDENSYQCTVKNAAGSKVSEFLNITVQYIDRPTLDKPNNVVMNETAPLSVTCSAISKPVTSYVWITKSGEVVSHGAILSFGSLRRTDSNEYECQALNAAGSKMSNRLTVIVQYIDIPTFNASTSITINETGQLYVSCSVASHPTTQYEWTTTSGKHITGSALLAFDSINRRNESAYQCKVMNAAGSKISTSLSIIVQYLDLPIITTNGSLSNSTNASTSCSTEGKPPPVISWKKDGVSVKNGSTIRWQPIFMSDNGSYTCHVSNVIGIKTKTEAIIVKYAPVITVMSSVSLPHVAIDSSLVLTCSVSSEPVSNVTWKKNNVLIISGNSISPLVVTLGRLQHVDTARYTCSAENREGQKSVIKQVIVQGPPDPPGGIITSQHGSRWIHVRWTAPHFDGNSPITTYKIRYGVDTSYKNEITGNWLSYNFTKLKPFTTYYFRLVVLNSKGSSSPADFSQKTKVEDPPKPTSLPKSPATTSPHTATIVMKKFSNDFGVIRFYQVIVMRVTSQSTTAPTSSLTNLNGFTSSSSSDPYITAEFSSRVFDQSDSYSFVIGDKRKTNQNIAIRRKRRAIQDYYNAPLLAQTTYKIFYRAFIDDNTFTSTDWIEFKTKQEPGLSGGAIAGVLIACHIFLALVSCAYVIYKKRKNKKEELAKNVGIATSIGIKGEFRSIRESRF